MSPLRVLRGRRRHPSGLSPILTLCKFVTESEAAMKTKESRFQVHDELTAPERSLPVLKGALAGGGQLSNILGVLAGSPATLRAYARFRSELRHGALPLRTQQRVALAVAEYQRSEYALATLSRTAREAGLGVDEVSLARRFESNDEREAAMLRYVRAVLESEGEG